MLHGDVRLNDVVIGEWSATNADILKGPFRRYDCSLWYRGLDGYIYEAAWEIWGVAHINGAISLASRVLREGMTKATKRGMGETCPANNGGQCCGHYALCKKVLNERSA